MTIDDEHRHEQSLAVRAASGDRTATEELLGRLYDQVFTVCRRVCANPSDGEDATQEALIKIARGLVQFDGRSAVRTWAHRIAVNAAIDEVRRRDRRPLPYESFDGIQRTSGRALSVAFTASNPSNVTSTAAQDLDDQITDRLAIDAALLTLTPEFRAALVLRDAVGMDYADIATTLDIPIGTVRSRISRARLQLREILGDGNQSDTSIVETRDND